MNELEIRKFFNFDDGDLTANRAGKISTDQMARLKQAEKSSSRYYFGLSVFLIALGAFFNWQILKSGAEDAVVGLVVLWLVLGVFIALFLSLAVYKPVYVLASAEGEVNFVKVEKTRREKSATGSERTKTYQVYEMRVGSNNFQNVPEDLLNLIKEGDAYKVHYIQDTVNILSVEPLYKRKEQN